MARKEIKKAKSRTVKSGLSGAGGEIIIYKTQKGPDLEVHLEEENVWLSQKQMSLLFDKDVKTINEHIKNVYQEGELESRPTIRNFQIVQKEGSRRVERDITAYNLDVVISIGYRVKSKNGTQFRIWATKTLKDHLVKGYTINERRVLEAREKLTELQKSISFLQEKSRHELLTSQGQEILDLLANYAKTLTLLEQYDKNQLVLAKKGKGKFILDYKNAFGIIAGLKKELAGKGEAGDLFGQEYGEKFRAILGNIRQSFGGKELYPSTEEKAAHLLYFIIKDHPFADGNKRIASFLFVYFLDKNLYLYKETGEKKINDNALVALALLIAISDPDNKEVMVKIITNLLKQ